MNAQNLANIEATFMPLRKGERVRSEGQEQRLHRRAVERVVKDIRKADRATKRSQAFA